MSEEHAADTAANAAGGGGDVNAGDGGASAQPGESSQPGTETASEGGESGSSEGGGDSSEPEPEPEKVGIKETTEFFAFLMSLAVAFSRSKADGEITAGDLPNLMGVIPTLGPALQGITGIPRELADVDNAEIAVIEQEIGTILRISGADLKTRRVIDHGLEVAFHISEIVKLVAGAKEPAADPPPAP